MSQFSGGHQCVEGLHIGKGVVLMPSFVNLGAYVDEGTMIDTWATVGSCAQIGKNCHISGGAGKNLMFSAIAKNLKKVFQDHNIVVVTPYPELLINNKYIDRVYKSGSTPYLYEDLLQGDNFSEDNQPPCAGASLRPWRQHYCRLRAGKRSAPAAGQGSRRRWPDRR
jgi:hypothetical protein